MGLLNRLFGKGTKVRKRDGNPDVYDMPTQNERMNFGIEKAGLTLHYFKECLANPKSGQVYFSVKAKVEDSGKTEHIWLTDPSFDTDGNVSGIVGNEPIDVTNIVIDQRIEITSDNVSDWMIVENGRLIGGYTIRAIREGIPESGLKKFDMGLGGILVDDGEDYFVPNLETPEGAILALEQAYDNDDLEKSISCKDFRKEAELMLIKSAREDINDELIDLSRELLELAFTKHMLENGMPKFDGVKRAFKRQQISDVNCLITEICYYPDGGESRQKLNIYKIDDQWKVLGLVE